MDPGKAETIAANFENYRRPDFSSEIDFANSSQRKLMILTGPK
jgi:hypothetical protein